MYNSQNVYGNLALRPITQNRTPMLKVIDSAHDKHSVFDDLSDQLLGSNTAKPFGNAQTAKAYAMSGMPILKTKEERRFAYIACVIASVAIFYFSFFAFM